MSNKKRGLSVVYSFQSPKFIFANVTFSKSQAQKKNAETAYHTTKYQKSNEYTFTSNHMFNQG